MKRKNVQASRAQNSTRPPSPKTARSEIDPAKFLKQFFEAEEKRAKAESQSQQERSRL